MQPNQENSPRLVLTGCGTTRELEALLESVTPPVARLLRIPRRAIANIADPHAALSGLSSSSNGWLADLPIDPGVPLTGLGNWAEALGAWRQPTLLVLDKHQMEAGLAAAYQALMRQSAVPLLGLIQWQGEWKQDSRKADGLPWLGWLPELDAVDQIKRCEWETKFVMATFLRWRNLDHRYSI